MFPVDFVEATMCVRMYLELIVSVNSCLADDPFNLKKKNCFYRLFSFGAHNRSLASIIIMYYRKVYFELLHVNISLKDRFVKNVLIY